MGKGGLGSGSDDGTLWVKEVMDELHVEDPEEAYHALRAVLHALRDHLTEEKATRLGSELPTLVRRIYFEGWRPTDKPLNEPHLDQFLMRLSKELTGGGPQGPLRISQGVFRVLRHHIAAGEINGIKRSLPAELEALWAEESGAMEETDAGSR